MYLLFAIATALFLWFLWPFVVNGAAFPVGPDAPVYMWWTRLAGTEGLSSVGDRPGIPALSLVIEGTLGLSIVQATAALEVALGTAVGLATAALVRRWTTAAGWTLAAVLAGTFAVHLAAGYVANLATAAAFLAAAALLDERGWRAVALSAVLLAGGGVAHPLFGLLAAAVLLGAAAGAWRSDRAESVRLGVAALAGSIAGGLGLLAVRPGAPPLEVDTSKDAFLRRAGLDAELRAAYLDRFVHRWTRYVQWASVPLALFGFWAAGGNAGRILRAWFVVTAVGVATALATGWLPADRFVTFGFAVPILAALGIVQLWRRLSSRRAVAFALSGIVTVAMLAGAFIAWNRQDPFLSTEEVTAIGVANRWIAGAAPGGLLRFTVDHEGPELSFLATRAANLIRAGVPPDRIRDVFVIVRPPDPGADASRTRRMLTRLSYRDAARAAIGRSPTRQDLRFVLRGFDPIGYGDADALGASAEIADGVKLFTDTAPVQPAAVGVEPLEPSSAAAIAWASAATLVMLWVVGYGWARAGLDDTTAAVAAAPAMGASVTIVVAVTLDAVGVGLGSTVGALAASVLAAAGGYLMWLVLERRTRSRPAPEIDEHPRE